MDLPSRCQKIDYDLASLKNIMEEALKENSSGSTTHSSPIGKRIKVAVPGSCANLGSGFDVFGIAVGLYLRADVEVRERKVLHAFSLYESKKSYQLSDAG